MFHVLPLNLPSAPHLCPRPALPCLQMTTVLSSRMLLPAFFECGMLLLRSMLILLRPTWQQCCPATHSAVLPPPLVSLATLAVAAVATAYQPNTDILLSMTGASGGGQPGITLMQVIADMMICPFQVFRWGGGGGGAAGVVQVSPGR